MRFTKLLWVLLALGACSHHDAKNGMTSKPVVNTVPMLIDGTDNSFNVAFITVTVCAPGTTDNCATIDHVLVDTGSVGLRIPADTLQATPALLAGLANETIGAQNVAECYVYASGYFFGTVRTADVTIAGETSKSMPVQIGGDITAGAPADCTNVSQGAPEIDSSMMLGGNAIIGIAPLKVDCGTACTSTATEANPLYFACDTTGTCTTAGVPTTQQIPNPIATFAADNNGYSITLPSIDDNVGAASPMGTLTFGIGTQSDNALGKGTVYTAGGEGVPSLSSTIGTTNFPSTVLDTGTPVYSITLPSLVDCTGQDFQGLYCPTTLQSVPITLTSSTNTTGTTTMKVADAMTLIDGSTQTTTAFDDLAEDAMEAGLPSDLFIMGLTHFYGRTIYFGMEGATIGTHVGPFDALQ